MKIVNPLYDKAFKYLMENEALARRVLAIILEEDIEELHLSQQETVVPDEFTEIANYLQQPVLDEEFRRQLEAEEEIDTIFDDQENKYLKQLEEERKQREAAEAEREAAKEREKQALLKMAKMMKNLGQDNETIARETGLGKEEIRALKRATLMPSPAFIA